MTREIATANGLGDLERAIMECLWASDEPLVVRQIAEQLEATDGKKRAYTTVMTVADRLAKKGLTSRERDGRAWRYSASATREELTAQALRETLADAPDLLAWALANGVRLRFIEQMPLDADQTWRRDHLVSAEELLSVLGRRYRLTPAGREDPSAPAEEWLVDGGPATVGIIGSVTRSFCDACDRTRLTAEGSVRSCLFGDDETDLRTMLRSGADDAAIADAWRATMWDKQAGHGMEEKSFRRPARSMGAIGG